MRNCSGNSYYGKSQPCSGGLISGNSVDINLNQNDSEVRVDIDVARINTIRIWGQVLDSDGSPISNALVKLVKPISMNGTCELQGVAHCVSDYNGFYQFDVPSSGDYNYKILVGKSAYSNERIICGHDCPSRPSSQIQNSCSQSSSCNPCNNHNEHYTQASEPYNQPCNSCNSCNRPNDQYNGQYADQYTDPCRCSNSEAYPSNYDSCRPNPDAYSSNYDSCKPCYDPCNSNYESSSSPCDPYGQGYDSSLPPLAPLPGAYKAPCKQSCDCCDGDNKYATYYYSEPETFE